MLSSGFGSPTAQTNVGTSPAMACSGTGGGLIQTLFRYVADRISAAVRQVGSASAARFCPRGHPDPRVSTGHWEAERLRTSLPVLGVDGSPSEFCTSYPTEGRTFRDGNGRRSRR